MDGPGPAGLGWVGHGVDGLGKVWQGKSNKMKVTQKHRRAEAERRRIYDWIVQRDGHLCIVCGRKAEAVHEVVPRGRWGGRSAEPFVKENMCCLCNFCHEAAQTVNGRTVICILMRWWYNYQYEGIEGFCLDRIVKDRRNGLGYLAENLENYIEEERV